MKFETLKQAVKHFTDNGINHDKGIEYVLAFQDAVGSRSMQDVLDSFQDMDKNERGQFLWVACHCLDKDTFLDILKKSVCNAIIEEEEDRLNEIHNDRLDAIEVREQKMTELENQNAVNEERIRYLELKLENSDHDRLKLSKKADSFDTIKNLLK